MTMFPLTKEHSPRTQSPGVLNRTFNGHSSSAEVTGDGSYEAAPFESCAFSAL